MAKRFLCYDTDNPKGVTPDGVLDTENLGGGSSEFDLVLTVNSYISIMDFRNNIRLLSGDNEYIGKTITKIINKEPVNIVIEQSYQYSNSMVYRTYRCFDYTYNKYNDLILKFIGTQDDVTPCIVHVKISQNTETADTHWYISGCNVRMITMNTN